MSIITVIGFVITTILLMVMGILSVLKPNLIGAEFYWYKYNWFYIPKYKVTRNVAYCNQIKIVGMGLIVSAMIMLIFTVVYIVNPHILLLFKAR